jgi:hypothetical protein
VYVPPLATTLPEIARRIWNAVATVTIDLLNNVRTETLHLWNQQGHQSRCPQWICVKCMPQTLDNITCSNAFSFHSFASWFTIRFTANWHSFHVYTRNMKNRLCLRMKVTRITELWLMKLKATVTSRPRLELHDSPPIATRFTYSSQVSFQKNYKIY